MPLEFPSREVALEVLKGQLLKEFNDMKTLDYVERHPKDEQLVILCSLLMIEPPSIKGGG